MAVTDAGARVRSRLRDVALTVVGLLALAARVADAQASSPRSSAALNVYADDDGLTVWHPSASVVAGKQWSVRATYDADVITAATVDVRTSASIRPFEEVRHGLGASVQHEFARGRTAEVRASASLSPDYQSVSGGVSFSLEDGARRDTVRISLDGSLSWVGRTGEPEPAGTLGAAGGALAWSRVLSERLVADVSLTGELLRGYQENPYRFVRVVGDGQAWLAVPESVPDLRLRLASFVGLRLALTRAIILRGGWRFHADDWGVRGHTFDPELVFALTEDLDVALAGRLLVQHGASFRRGAYLMYPDLPRWRTHDRELASGWSGRLLLSVRWRLPELYRVRIAVAVRGGLERYRYIDSPLLPDKNAALGGIALIGEWR